MVNKNKAGDFKKRYVYFNQWPEQYYCEECDEEDQKHYNNMVIEQSGNKIRNYGSSK